MCARMIALPHSYSTVRCAVEHRYGTEELFVDGDVIGSTFCDNSFAGVRFLSEFSNCFPFTLAYY